MFVYFNEEWNEYEEEIEKRNDRRRTIHKGRTLSTSPKEDDTEASRG